MKSHFAAAAVMIAALAAPALAQQPPPGPPSTTLKVQVVLSRYQGEKKISSLPYMLAINADEKARNIGRGSIRLGTQVPITTMVRQNGGSDGPLVPSVQYRDVGTSIDCVVTALEDSRFKVELTVDDSAVDTGLTGSNSTHPVFRSFRSSDTMMLRDGQSAQYSTGTDKVSGDVWKVDVTLNVVK